MLVLRDRFFAIGERAYGHQLVSRVLTEPVVSRRDAIVDEYEPVITRLEGEYRERQERQDTMRGVRLGADRG